MKGAASEDGNGDLMSVIRLPGLVAHSAKLVLSAARAQTALAGRVPQFTALLP